MKRENEQSSENQESRYEATKERFFKIVTNEVQEGLQKKFDNNEQFSEAEMGEYVRLFNFLTQDQRKKFLRMFIWEMHTSGKKYDSDNVSRKMRPLFEYGAFNDVVQAVHDEAEIAGDAPRIAMEIFIHTVPGLGKAIKTTNVQKTIKTEVQPEKEISEEEKENEIALVEKNGFCEKILWRIKEFSPEQIERLFKILEKRTLRRNEIYACIAGMKYLSKETKSAWAKKLAQEKLGEYVLDVLYQVAMHGEGSDIYDVMEILMKNVGKNMYIFEGGQDMHDVAYTLYLLARKSMERGGGIAVV